MKTKDKHKKSVAQTAGLAVCGFSMVAGTFNFSSSEFDERPGKVIENKWKRQKVRNPGGSEEGRPGRYGLRTMCLSRATATTHCWEDAMVPATTQVRLRQLTDSSAWREPWRAGGRAERPRRSALATPSRRAATSVIVRRGGPCSTRLFVLPFVAFLLRGMLLRRLFSRRLVLTLIRRSITCRAVLRSAPRGFACVWPVGFASLGRLT